jgi:hypothetical protein
MPCLIVFGADPAGKALGIKVDLDANRVAQQLGSADGLVQFEVEGKAVWINAANVLYVREEEKGGPQFFALE